MTTKGVSGYLFQVKKEAIQFAKQMKLLVLQTPDGMWIVVTRIQAARLVTQGYKVVYRG